MDEHDLILTCENLLENADSCLSANDHDGYCARMSELIHLLMDELVGDAPTPNVKPPFKET